MTTPEKLEAHPLIVGELRELLRVKKMEIPDNIPIIIEDNEWCLLEARAIQIREVQRLKDGRYRFIEDPYERITEDDPNEDPVKALIVG